MSRDVRLRIAIEATGIVPGTSAGVENFTYRVVRGMALAGRDHTFHVLVPRGTANDWSDRLSGLQNVEIREVLTPAAIRSIPHGAVPRRSGLRWAAMALRRIGFVRDIALAWKSRQRQAAIARLAPDVVYLPTHLGGAPNWTCVVTVHDLRSLSTDFRDHRAGRILASAVQRANAVVTAWEHPRSQLIARFPWVESKLEVIPFPPMVDAEDGPIAKRDRPYLLYPAGTAQHKNHLRLVEALSAVRRTRDVWLVCTGPTIEPGYSELKAAVRRLSLVDAVELADFVSDDELKALYRGAAAVVVPSMWEAASGPVMEAQAYGKPVACARIPPIEQQVQRAGMRAEFFDPRNVNEMAHAIQAVLDHPERYQEQPSGTTPAPDRRTWTDVGLDYLAVIESVARGSRRSPGQ